MTVESPYYPLVPKTLAANLAFRRGLIARGSQDAAFAESLRAMCSEDLLFFVNTFGWTYDPRKTPPVIPFLTYEFQDETLLDL